ncbi:MAG: transcriptional regulator PpsR [Hyphomicrobium sp.]|nr:transcriptional regulator PpsR [Hyphomicrobium sp.]
MDSGESSRRIADVDATHSHFAHIEGAAIAQLLGAAADIALVIDGQGVIGDVALATEDMEREGCSDWIGRRWIDTVANDSRQKVEEMLQASTATSPLWHQVNHPVRGSADLPVRYSAVHLGETDQVLAIGRDMRAVSTMQQRLVEAQQSMESDYARLRHAETRYRLLFQVTGEAVLILDADSNRIVESNRTACTLFDLNSQQLAGRCLRDLFDAKDHKRIQTLLTGDTKGSLDEELIVRLAGTKIDVSIAASPVSQHPKHVLVRLTPTSGNASAWLKSRSNVFEVLEKLPDGFVVTDQDGRILTANTAFIDLTQLAIEPQVCGERIDRWVGRHAIDTAVIDKTLKECGRIQNFSTLVRGEYGACTEVEITAVSVFADKTPCVGMTLRPLRRQRETAVSHRPVAPSPSQQMAKLLGHASMADLVQESTEMIERLCIEAALEQTGYNRASAAELLGLSRQALYTKLHRYRLAGFGSDHQD